MKKVVLLLSFISFFSLAYGQKKPSKLVEQFKQAENDSVFISKHSLVPFRVFEVKKSRLRNDFANEFDSLIFLSEPRQVLGPFDHQGQRVYLKTIQVDSVVKMRVGNIFIKGDAEKANRVLKAALKGEDFSKLCKDFSDDRNTKAECDLGWFYEDTMVDSFEKEVQKHKKGDIFLTQTEYGYHIVKVLEDYVRDRSRVKYVQLVVK